MKFGEEEEEEEEEEGEFKCEAWVVMIYSARRSGLRRVEYAFWRKDESRGGVQWEVYVPEPRSSEPGTEPTSSSAGNDDDGEVVVGFG